MSRIPPRMRNNSEGNISKAQEVKQLSTGEFIQVMTKSLIAYAKTNAIKDFPSVFIQGQPGIGKSQAVARIAKNIEKELNKKVHVQDIRLLLFNPVDLRGIPVADMEEKVAIWLKPKLFNLDASEDVINVLFLDELTAAPSSLQAAAYQIALDRQLGEHRLPDNTFILGAGNRTNDNAIAYDMPTALRNRFIHFELVLDLDDWLIWAEGKGIHPYIVEFLNNHPDKFAYSDLNTESFIIITPRSWEILSDLLNTLGGEVKTHETFIASVIGNSLTSLLLNSDDNPLVKQILNGETVQAPRSMSELQRVMDTLVVTLKRYRDDKEVIENILNFSLLIPIDYAVRLFKEIVREKFEGFELTEIVAFNSLMKKMEEVSIDE